MIYIVKESEDNEEVNTENGGVEKTELISTKEEDFYEEKEVITKDGIAVDMLTGSEANDSTSDDSSTKSEENERGKLKIFFFSQIFVHLLNLLLRVRKYVCGKFHSIFFLNSE